MSSTEADPEKAWLERHYKQAVEESVALTDQLLLATEFRIPCTNETGGYAEITVERGMGPKLWAVTDGSFTGRRAWVNGGWQYLSDVGKVAAYRHTRKEALDLGRQVAAIEGAGIDAHVARLIAAQESATGEADRG